MKKKFAEMQNVKQTTQQLLSLVVHENQSSMRSLEIKFQ